MYVCLCEGVTDHVVRSAIARGAATVEQLTKACGAGARCGGCRPELERWLHGQSHPLVDLGQAPANSGTRLERMRASGRRN